MLQVLGVLQVGPLLHLLQEAPQRRALHQALRDQRTKDARKKTRRKEKEEAGTGGVEISCRGGKGERGGGVGR